MLLGNVDVSEKCMQVGREMDKLNMLYCVTGQVNKLRKMGSVAQTIGDPTLRFNTALYTGDVQERVKVLAETGQIPLAYMMAKTHGLTEFAKTLEETL